MRIHIAILGIVAATCLGNSAHADDKAKAMMEYLAGTWEFTNPDGAKGKVVFKKVDNVDVLSVHGEAGDESWVAMWGFRKNTGDIKTNSYNSNGGYGSAIWKIDDNGDLVANQSGWGPEGKSSGKMRIKKIDEKHFSFKAWDQVRGDQKLDDAEMKVTRK